MPSTPLRPPVADRHPPRSGRAGGCGRRLSLLPGDRLAQAGQFYSEGEYDLTPLAGLGAQASGTWAGPACMPTHRGGTAMFHLWNGLADYVLERGIEVLFGVASFHGTDARPWRSRCPGCTTTILRPRRCASRARPPMRQEMDLLPPVGRLDRKAAMAATPALIKAYLRLGGFVGDGAWIDHAFNTTDVCLVMDTGQMSARHRDFYIRARQGRCERLGRSPVPPPDRPAGWLRASVARRAAGVADLWRASAAAAVAAGRGPLLRDAPPGHAHGSRRPSAGPRWSWGCAFRCMAAR
jgi:hypothetical protein